MNVDEAKEEIEKFFSHHGASIRKASIPSSKGKVYELYCLSRTIEQLKDDYDARIQFIGTTLDFKASPGKIDHSKSYFTIDVDGELFELHTDIEVRTLGSALGSAYLQNQPDRSEYHEIDLVVIDAKICDRARPSYEDLALGVECKAHENFTKSILKQVLGIRRELSFLVPPRPTRLNHKRKTVPARPSSEYWLAYADPNGDNYKSSPATFGIEFLKWCP